MAEDMFDGFDHTQYKDEVEAALGQEGLRRQRPLVARHERRREVGVEAARLRPRSGLDRRRPRAAHRPDRRRGAGDREAPRRVADRHPRHARRRLPAETSRLRHRTRRDVRRRRALRRELRDERRRHRRAPSSCATRSASTRRRTCRRRSAQTTDAAPGAIAGCGIRSFLADDQLRDASRAGEVEHAVPGRLDGARPPLRWTTTSAPSERRVRARASAGRVRRAVHDRAASITGPIPSATAPETIDATGVEEAPEDPGDHRQHFADALRDPQGVGIAGCRELEDVATVELRRPELRQAGDPRRPRRSRRPHVPTGRRGSPAPTRRRLRSRGRRRPSRPTPPCAPRRIRPSTATPAPSRSPASSTTKSSQPDGGPGRALGDRGEVGVVLHPHERDAAARSRR